ncbi:hypothetical protein [uncultured Clostridium sp.]|uniref:hypothetical protein n=1 Tax=uncultured Clostridium sp. TaxID=59620 RepID=UPI0028E33A8B|nr:hypothetical protein [uncultured Clostridium sp.]
MNEESKRRLNVSEVMKILGVSRSGYTSFKKRLLPDRIKRKKDLKVKIKEIYDESHQNYCAPKITEVLHQKVKL